MRLASLTLRPLVIPFRAAFRHAAAARSQTETAWVEARADGDIVGYGEGCPRRYVTGEDLATTQQFLARHRSDLVARIRDLGDLVQWVRRHHADIDRNPAAWCAVELALLDALAKEHGASVEALLGLRSPGGAHRFSAVVGIDGRRGFQATVQRYRALGFDDFKIKLSGDRGRDRANLAWLKAEVGHEGRIRVDANNLWDSAEDAVHHLEPVAPLVPVIFAIEEPLPPARYAALAEIATRTGARIVLDESVLRAAQLPLIAEAGRQWILNVRVSKMGGILRALEVVAAARAHGFPIIVGAHVGETSLLTRAALTVAAQARDLLVAQEGAFGTHLLTSDVTDPALAFGPGGYLELARPDDPGFGLTVTNDLPFAEAI